MFKKAFLATVPVMAGYIVLGIGFGMVLLNHGLSVPYAGLMSLVIYAGSMQFVAIDLMSTGAGLLTTFLTTVAVNARHIFYGISMLDKYKNIPHKPLLVWTLTDETYSLVCAREPEHKLGLTGDGSEAEKKLVSRYCLLVSVFDYGYWVLGSVLGAVIGSLLTINTTGIDFALTALFITVFTEQWLTTKNHISAIIGVVCTTACLLLFGRDAFLIPAMCLIMICLTLLRKQKGITNEEVNGDER